MLAHHRLTSHASAHALARTRLRARRIARAAAALVRAQAVADIIRTTLGPKSMLKMLLDPTGGIVMTNDGNAILREVDVSHPGAKSMVELSRAQDEEVGDGTTSVIVIAGEMLHVAEPLLLRDFHPTVICSGFLRALDDALVVLRELAFPIDLTNRAELSNLVRSSIGTKFISRFSDQMVELALDAVQTVYIDSGGRKEIDIKRYAKVEKLPGGDIEHSRVRAAQRQPRRATRAAPPCARASR